jgi:hypothetical protein
MKVYFDNDGTLVVAAENNTDMIALAAWDDERGAFLVKPKEHQEIGLAEYLNDTKIK